MYEDRPPRICKNCRRFKLTGVSVEGGIGECLASLDYAPDVEPLTVVDSGTCADRTVYADHDDYEPNEWARRDTDSDNDKPTTKDLQDLRDLLANATFEPNFVVFPLDFDRKPWPPGWGFSDQRGRR